MKRKAQWDYEAEIEGWYTPDPNMPPGWPDNITAPPKDEEEYQQRVAEWRSRQKPAYLVGVDARAADTQRYGTSSRSESVPCS
jgi:hypothetical protein